MKDMKKMILLLAVTFMGYTMEGQTKKVCTCKMKQSTVKLSSKTTSGFTGKSKTTIKQKTGIYDGMQIQKTPKGILINYE
jgi:hypothetical protein